MGSFDASLKTVGDREGLPATLNVEDGRLHIAAGEADIGNWDLNDIRLEPTPTGYRLAAEGEQLLIEMPDIDRFASEISKASKRKSLLKAVSLPLIGSRGEDTETEPSKADTSTKVEQPASPTRRAEPDHSQAPDTEPTEERPSTSERTGIVDRTIASAERRWGSLLPSWVFTRVMFGVVVGTLLTAIIFPGLVATILLLSGVLMVTFGAIVYSDNMLASKWLPGRTTPIHVLLFGVAILMLGVLLALVAG